MIFKKSLSALIIACVCVLTPVSVLGNMGDKVDVGEGGLSSHSAPIYSLIQISVTSGSVGINFDKSYGVVDITVTDANGFTIYWESVDTSISSQHKIDTFSYPSGTYKIEITNSSKQILKTQSFTVN